MSNTIGRKLRDLYFDETNYLYLLFLRPIPAEINKINMRFQQNSTEVTKLFVDLRILLIALSRRILKASCIQINNDGTFLSSAAFEVLNAALNNPAQHLPLNMVDYGASFTIHLGKINISQEALEYVKQRCVSYLVVLCKQLAKRLPTNIHQYETLQYLNPAECMKPPEIRVDFLKLPLFLVESNSDIDVLKLEWDKLTLIDLMRYFNGTIPDNSEKFWCGIRDMKDSSGSSMFANISKFALRVLSLPFSNAFIERVLSFMNTIKTKSRNRMSIDILMSIMRVRIRFAQTKICCNKFEPTMKMYELFTSQMYSQMEKANGGTEDNNTQETLDNLFYKTLEMVITEET